MQTTPKGLRPHVALLGRRNAGKSSLFNLLVGQSASIVSDTPGTTTDPVEKALELHPAGPVVLVDTAGLDDAGTLGALRARRARAVLDRTDAAVLVVGPEGWGAFEAELADTLARRRIPTLVALAQADRWTPPPSLTARLTARGLEAVPTRAAGGGDVAALREALLRALPARPPDAAIVRDLVAPGAVCLLVAPIDAEAPRGRLVLPQVQTLRDLLDGHALALVARETEVRAALAALTRPPALVVTDSQALREVAAHLPEAVPLTGFSILFARLKGDLVRQAQAAAAISRLRPGDRVLVAEACAHHAVGDDIGRAKIPRWLEARVGGPLRFTHVRGHDLPEDLPDHRLAIHCGACVLTAREVRARLARAAEAGVPMTNYGLAIAACHGLLERALAPFPEARAACRREAAGGPP